MIRYLLNKMLVAMRNRYDYDVGYMQEILKTDLGAFLKLMAFQTMPSHSGKLPAAVLYAARITTLLSKDCGPCTQLAVNIALEEKVSPSIVQAIIDKDMPSLPGDIALVVRFTELVLAHSPEADDLRKEIVALWGSEGLIALAYSISSYRVYPALKYALGYGRACTRILVNETAAAVLTQKNG